MYYDEKIIDGKLYHRTTPDGKWKESTGVYADAVNSLLKLDDVKRLEVFGFFCKYCGTLDPHCQCWNDE